MERLQKIIARSGLASRREAERRILEGRVTVNGAVIRRLGYHADPSRDKIKVDGRLIPPTPGRLYYLFHKPPGLITSMGDPRARPNLGNWLEPFGGKERLFPVGRLDYNSSGLLLLTNHGELCYRLSHPRYEVRKVYKAKISGLLFERELERLRRGILLGDGLTAAARVRILRRLKKKTWLEIEIHEGRYREVRRMFEALGYSVEKLVRTHLGPIRLGSLPMGKIRSLSSIEIAALQRAVGLSAKNRPRSKYHKSKNPKALAK
ncbi:MAG: pseudouridine synthase [Candidatus Binatia bacterium]